MADSWYTRGLYEIVKNNLDVETATLKAMLVGSGYTFNKDHDYVADVVAGEVAPTGYARVTLTGVTITLDDTNDRVVIDCNDVDFGALGGAANATTTKVIFYREVTNDADSPVICQQDFVTTTDGNNVKVIVGANGLARIQN